jgi:vacuolar-type H+-ATPase subunit B/Vma2
MTTVEEQLVNSYLDQQTEYDAKCIEIRNALKNGEISVDSLKEAFVNRIIEIEVPSDWKATMSNKLKGRILNGKGSHLNNWEELFPKNDRKEELNVLIKKFRSTVIYITH